MITSLLAAGMIASTTATPVLSDTINKTENEDYVKTSLDDWFKFYLPKAISMKIESKDKKNGIGYLYKHKLVSMLQKQMDSQQPDDDHFTMVITYLAVGDSKGIDVTTADVDKLITKNPTELTTIGLQFYAFSYLTGFATRIYDNFLPKIILTADWI